MINEQRMSLFSEIDAERAKQDAEWGGPEHDDEHHAGEWSEFLRKHWQRANAAAFDTDRPTFRRQLVIVAALAVAALEWCDRRGA